MAQTGPVEQPLQQALVDAARHLRPRQCGQRRGQGCGCRLPKVMDVMALGGERPVDAKYLVVTSFGTAQKMHGGKPLEPYYSCIPLEDCLEDETIFAWSMNDKPLPWTFGAPMRLRVESIHGYKMVKYIRSLEWIADYSTIGDGMGGTREDSGYQAINARI